MASLSMRSLESRLKKLERTYGSPYQTFLDGLSEDELSALVNSAIVMATATATGLADYEARERGLQVICELLGCTMKASERFLNASEAASSADPHVEFSRYSHEELDELITETWVAIAEFEAGEAQETSKRLLAEYQQAHMVKLP